MSLEKIHLDKLLRILYSPENKKTGFLRDDIRQGIRKASGTKSEGGGHFYCLSGVTSKIMLPANWTCTIRH
jgi:hypothetical protein